MSRILVIDDDSDFLDVLRQELNAVYPGITIDTALDFDVATKHLNTHTYSMILSDYYVSTKRCDAFLDSCFELTKPATTRIFVVTGSTQDVNILLPITHRERVEIINKIDFVSKPAKYLSLKRT